MAAAPNRLIHETSPYLLQHAYNPVDWYPWGEEAFAKARAENKPILLSIGYSACHWCHVMERESFENEEIAALMNKLFVNIKVDREERPDLDEIYMNAVQMLTGRGGWPMTVFLTPEGKPFYGGTYFPPEDRYGVPGFPRILVGVANAYRENPEQVARNVDQILHNLQRLAAPRETSRAFDPDIVGHAVEKLAAAYDPRHGGLGQAPKFPNAGVYELFLRHYRHTGDRRSLEMLTHTLDRMAAGGIYDHLGGGFHRYSVDEKWLVPHFEKMLYDNAQLLRVYAQAYRVTGSAGYKRVVQKTLEYLLREMRSPEGGFYSTQDADSEGEEGRFFVWTAAEINALLGKETGEIFARVYDVTEHGNFEGKNILHPVLSIEQASRLFRKEPVELEAMLDDARRVLRQAREGRPKPFRDEKILTAWNGLMLSGLAEALRTLPGASSCRDAAAGIRDFVFSKLFTNGRLLHTYKDGTAKLPGFLDDYAFMAAGLLDLYETVFDRSLLEQSLALATGMIEEFWDSKDGGFFYTGDSHEQLIARAKPVFDGSIPSGNAAAVHVLLRLYHYGGNQDFLDRAERVLRNSYEAMESQPFGFAHMLAAMDFYLRKPKEIVLVGRPEEPALKRMIETVHSRYLPNMTIQLAGVEQPLERISPLLAGKSAQEGRATAYVCHSFACSLPVTDPQELSSLLG